MSLDAPALATLRAMLDRLIPRDEFPSATEAGADVYIVRQLTGDLRNDEPFFADGLAALAAEAVHVHRANFAQLSTAQQDLILEAVSQGGVVTTWPVSPTSFFQRLNELAAEGYYADPGQGGNRDQVAWQMIGYQRRVPARPTAP